MLSSHPNLEYFGRLGSQHVMLSGVRIAYRAVTGKRGTLHALAEHQEMHLMAAHSLLNAMDIMRSRKCQHFQHGELWNVPSCSSLLLWGRRGWANAPCNEVAGYNSA